MNTSTRFNAGTRAFRNKNKLSRHQAASEAKTAAAAFSFINTRSSINNNKIKTSFFNINS